MTDPADGCACTQLTQLREAGDCGAVRQRVAQVVTARLNATQARIVELVEDAARLQSEAAATCTLDGGVDAMRGRISEWQAAIAPAVGREAVAGGVALTFNHDADLVVELARLAAAEYACCRFFTFSLTVNGQGVRFEASAPEAVRDVISAVFGVAPPAPVHAVNVPDDIT